MTKNTLRKDSISKLVQASLRRCDILGINIPISHMISFENKEKNIWVPNMMISEKSHQEAIALSDENDQNR